MTAFAIHSLAISRASDEVRRSNMLSQAIKNAMRTLSIVFTALAAAPAQADLGCNGLGLGNTIDAGGISIPMGATSGQTVLTLPPSTFQAQCLLTKGQTSGITISTLTTTTTPAPGFDDVYPTSVPGLGVRYTFNGDKTCDAQNLTMKNGKIAISYLVSGIPDSAVWLYSDMTVTPSLVVTGAVKGGASVLSSAPIVKFTIKDAGGSWPKADLYGSTATGTLMTAACSVQTPGIAITLPTVATRSLASVGVIAGRQAFNLSFACAAGAQVSIVITDAVDPSNRSNVLKLAAESTAKGVGVQVLKAGHTPVLFGPDAIGQNVENQWLIGASPNGLLELPLSAQYIRTGDLAAGSIKALATFTMSYQ
ncbi:fimbrial protein [Caballeronia sp. 15711]|uniref:fimbrial protein n=2 Tax=unclassified Caballeronia TaxID=2646786 RepID=UPI0039E42CDD